MTAWDPVAKTWIEVRERTLPCFQPPPTPVKKHSGFERFHYSSRDQVYSENEDGTSDSVYEAKPSAEFLEEVARAIGDGLPFRGVPPFSRPVAGGLVRVRKPPQVSLSGVDFWADAFAVGAETSAGRIRIRFDFSAYTEKEKRYDVRVRKVFVPDRFFVNFKDDEWVKWRVSRDERENEAFWEPWLRTTLGKVVSECEYYGTL